MRLDLRCLCLCLCDQELGLSQQVAGPVLCGEHLLGLGLQPAPERLDLRADGGGLGGSAGHRVDELLLDPYGGGAPPVGQDPGRRVAVVLPRRQQPGPAAM